MAYTYTKLRSHSAKRPNYDSETEIRSAACLCPCPSVSRGPRHQRNNGRSSRHVTCEVAPHPRRRTPFTCPYSAALMRDRRPPVAVNLMPADSTSSPWQDIFLNFSLCFPVRVFPIPFPPSFRRLRTCCKRRVHVGAPGVVCSSEYGLSEGHVHAEMRLEIVLLNSL